MSARHTHWCHAGRHFVYNCDCNLELPMNVACQACLKKADAAKDKAVQEALEKIIDADKGPVIK